MSVPGDLIRAVVTMGTKQGTCKGQVTAHACGSFNITTANGVVQGISYRFCTTMHQVDGYSYTKGEAAFPPAA